LPPNSVYTLESPLMVIPYSLFPKTYNPGNTRG
jgi:hypothetical protein